MDVMHTKYWQTHSQLGQSPTKRMTIKNSEISSKSTSAEKNANKLKFKTNWLIDQAELEK